MYVCMYVYSNSSSVSWKKTFFVQDTDWLNASHVLIKPQGCDAADMAACFHTHKCAEGLYDYRDTCIDHTSTISNRRENMQVDWSHSGR